MESIVTETHLRPTQGALRKPLLALLGAVALGAFVGLIEMFLASRPGVTIRSHGGIGDHIVSSVCGCVLGFQFALMKKWIKRETEAGRQSTTTNLVKLSVYAILSIGTLFAFIWMGTAWFEFSNVPMIFGYFCGAELFEKPSNSSADSTTNGHGLELADGESK